MKLRRIAIYGWVVCTRRIRDGGLRLRDVLGAIACLLLMTPSIAAADAGQCARAIAKAGAAYVQATLTASQHCEDAVMRGKFAGPCPEEKTTAKLARIRAKLDDSIRSKCGGSDRACEAGGDDDPLAAIGWNIGQCPGVTGGEQCKNVIANCTDVATCIDCIEGAITDAAITLAFGAFTARSPATTVGKCQREIGKQWASFLDHRTRALQRCEDGLLTGRIAGPCPDAKTATVLAKLETKLERALCRKCGGSYRRCGSADDFTPAAIGFAADCPNVTIPAGVTCSAPVTTLTELVGRPECVGQYDSECLTRLAAPAVASYPVECRPPNGTCLFPILVPAFGGLVDVYTIGAANNFSSTCGGSGAPESVLQWTPDVSGTATVNTCLSTTFDTVIYVRQTDCAGGANITCDDNNCTPGSLISFNVVAGETYFIFVDGTEGQEGQTTVTIIPPTE